MGPLTFRAALLAALVALAAALGGCSSDGSAAPDAPANSDGGGGYDLPRADVAPQPDIVSPDYGTIPDTFVGDISVGDAFSGDGAPVPPAVCATTAPALVLHEIAVAQPDYVALENVGSTPLDLKGYTLVLSGISPTAVFTVPSSVKLMPGEIAYVFEYSKGKMAGDINTGANIPFYDGPPTATDANAAALYAPGGELLDYVAIATEVNLPSGASFVAIPWPSAFDSSTHSFQRVKHSGKCPNFRATDWKPAPLTRP